VNVESYYYGTVPESCVEGEIEYKNINAYREDEGPTKQFMTYPDLYFSIENEDGDDYADDWSEMAYHSPIKMKKWSYDKERIIINVYFGSWANTP